MILGKIFAQAMRLCKESAVQYDSLPQALR